LESKVKIPVLGWLKLHSLTKGLPEGKLASSVRLIKKASGWYAVLLFEQDHEQKLNDTDSVIGIDTGFKHLAILSNGQKFENPRELEASSKQLARVQRGRHKRATACLQERIANQRKDRNHKISHDLIRDHAQIYITNDNLRGQAHKFGKSVTGAGTAQLRNFILYKGSSCGRTVKLVESRNTTLTCSGCEAHTGPSGLSKLNIRFWVCEACGASHDRDVNAAINVLNTGLRYSLEASKDAAEPEKVKSLKKLGLSSQNCPGRAVI